MDILRSQRTRLLEEDPLIVGKLTSISWVYLLLCTLVNFIPDEKDNDIGISLFSDWFDPSFNIMESFLFCDIIDHQCPQCFPIMSIITTIITLLLSHGIVIAQLQIYKNSQSTGIPDLCFYSFTVL